MVVIEKIRTIQSNLTVSTSPHTFPLPACDLWNQSIKMILNQYKLSIGCLIPADVSVLALVWNQLIFLDRAPPRQTNHHAASAPCAVLPPQGEQPTVGMNRVRRDGRGREELVAAQAPTRSLPRRTTPPCTGCRFRRSDPAQSVGVLSNLLDPKSCRFLCA
jgi:hypothetical protein